MKAQTSKANCVEIPSKLTVKPKQKLVSFTEGGY